MQTIAIVLNVARDRADEFERGLRETVEWYGRNAAWIEGVRSGEYRTYYHRQYGPV